jgi:hypothetical protein
MSLSGFRQKTTIGNKDQPTCKLILPEPVKRWFQTIFAHQKERI